MRDAKGRFLPDPRTAIKAAEDQQFLDQFLVQVRAELAEIYAQVDGQPRGGSRQTD